MRGRIKSAVKGIIYITLPAVLIVILLLEVFFRLVIPASNPPSGYFDEEERIHRFDHRLSEGMVTVGKSAEIRARWRINNAGWNSPVDYYPAEEREKKLIAVIGDSYIEGLHIDVDKSYPYLLRERLFPEYEHDVYTFGRSIYPLSQYLHISRYVKRQFRPDIIIFHIVYNDFDESIYELHPRNRFFLQISFDEEKNITETVPQPNYQSAQHRKGKRILRKYSALVRYMTYNIQARHIIRNLGRRRSYKDRVFEENINYERVRSEMDIIYRATDYIVKTIVYENRDERVIFVMDAPRRAIYDGKINESNVIWMNEMMEEICRKNGAEFIDLTLHMYVDYSTNKKRFNSEIDWHYNEYGHRFVADVLCSYLGNDM